MTMADLEKPTIVVWQHRYCAFMSAVYVFCIFLGVFLFVFAKDGGEQHSESELLITGVLTVVLGAVLAVAYGVAPFLRPARWVWIYHMVLIGFGFTSVCCVPVCIPLLVKWVKPETQAYFKVE